MLDYYNDTNKEEETLLDEVITMEIDSRLQNTSSYNWKIMRRRTKQYKYVGMDRATAKACVAAKRAQYLRTFYTWTYSNGRWTQNTSAGGQYKRSVATITPQRLTGSMWNVNIQVDETCIAYVIASISGSEIVNPGQAVDSYCGSSNWSYDE